METTSKKSAFPIFVFTGVMFLLGAFGARYLVYLNRDQPSVDKERGKARLEARLKLDEEDAKLLQATEWADESKGLARIPIERAMEITATELQMKTVQASSVAVPVPGAAEQAPAAPATEPAASEIQAPADAPAPQPAAEEIMEVQVEAEVVVPEAAPVQEDEPSSQPAAEEVHQ